MIGRYDEIDDDLLADDPCYKRNPQDPASPLYRSYGLPGFTTFALRGGVRLFDQVTLTGAIENLTNWHFRRAHSRWDEPGTNFLIDLSFVVGSPE